MADGKKLSSLDASFLYLETPEMPMRKPSEPGHFVNSILPSTLWAIKKTYPRVCFGNSLCLKF